MCASRSTWQRQNAGLTLSSELLKVAIERQKESSVGRLLDDAQVQRDASIARKLTWMNMLVSGIALLVGVRGFHRATTWSPSEPTMVRNLSTAGPDYRLQRVSALLFNDPQSAENTLSALEAAPNVVVCWYLYAETAQSSPHTRAITSDHRLRTCHAAAR